MASASMSRRRSSPPLPSAAENSQCVPDEPVHAFCPVVIPFRVTALQIKHNILAHTTSSLGIIFWPGSGFSVGVLVDKEVDPCLVHESRELLGLGNVLDIITTEWINSVSETIQVVEDESNLHQRLAAPQTG